MKRRIRRRTFETNSSSCHSVAIKSHKLYYPDFEYQIWYDNYFHVYLKDFGWKEEEYYDAYTKLQYAIGMVIATELRNSRYMNLIGETEGFIAIENLIKDRYEVNGIIIEKNHRFPEYGYIDHQSTDDYYCLKDFLDDYKVTLEEFIFGDVVLRTDNDNH